LQIKIHCITNIDISSPSLEEICKQFGIFLKIVIREFFTQILLCFAEDAIRNGSSLIQCDKCHNSHRFIWKTRHGKATSIMTIFGALILDQLQVQCKACGHKQFITRHLLGIGKRIRLPQHTIRHLGLVGALTTFRVAQKIVGLFGVTLDKMSIWRSVQKLGKEITFDLDPDEQAHGEADGTGVPIQGIKKRGKEMKVFVQLKRSGGVRIAGVSIGQYDGQWEKLFEPLLTTLSTFKSFLLVTDGDTNILKGLGEKVNIVFQRCLWHIPHQFKWYLWKDNVKRKSRDWLMLLSELLNIVNVKAVQHDKECVDSIVNTKRKQLESLIAYSRRSGRLLLRYPA